MSSPRSTGSHSGRSSPAVETSGVPAAAAAVEEKKELAARASTADVLLMSRASSWSANDAVSNRFRSNVEIVEKPRQMIVLLVTIAGASYLVGDRTSRPRFSIVSLSLCILRAVHSARVRACVGCVFFSHIASGSRGVCVPPPHGRCCVLCTSNKNPVPRFVMRTKAWGALCGWLCRMGLLRLFRALIGFSGSLAHLCL